MARLSTDGIEDFEKKLQRIEKGLRGEAIESMLNAGADVLIASWKSEISDKHHKTGQMEASVDKTPVRAGKDGMYIEVYPMGVSDNHRINNAQKAFILHHGRRPNAKGKKEIKGDKFVTAAENAAKEKALAAMQAKLNEYIAGKE